MQSDFYNLFPKNPFIRYDGNDKYTWLVSILPIKEEFYQLLFD